MKNLLILLTLVFVLGGCASKRFVKKASMLENSGLYADAADNYFNSLKKNINNIDAKLGLKRTGQLVLDEKIEKFKSQYQSGNAKDAVYAFKSAESYLNKVQGVGIKLIFPEEQRTYYTEVEDTYLNKLYGDASRALSLEEFSAAEEQFDEIISINATYKDSRSKWIIAKYEPLYRQGNEQMGNEMYRSAYLTFKEIIDGVKTYENSVELMNQSLEEAKVTIYVSSVNTKYSSYKTIAGLLTNKVVKGINGINSPLYEVVGTGTAIKSSSDSFSKAYLYDRTKGVANSRVMPDSKAILVTDLQKYAKKDGKLVKTEKHAYVKRTVEYTDEETKLKKTKTVYDKVKYYEYTLNRSVSLTVGYAMNRTDREELAVSDSFNKEEVEELHYATFDGDYKKLVPGTWKYLSKESDSDKVYDSASAISKLRKLFEAEKTPRTISEMENTLMDDCVSQMTVQIQNYKPEN